VVAAPVKLGVNESTPVPDRPVVCPDDVPLPLEDVVPPDELLPVPVDPEQAPRQTAARTNEATYLMTRR
jgi:hypothetical protein